MLRDLECLMTGGALFQSFFASLSQMACANMVLAVSGMMVAFVALVVLSLAARPVFVCSIYLIYDFLAGNNYPDSPLLAGGYEICHTNFTST